VLANHRLHVLVAGAQHSVAALCRQRPAATARIVAPGPFPVWNQPETMACTAVQRLPRRDARIAGAAGQSDARRCGCAHDVRKRPAPALARGR